VWEKREETDDFKLSCEEKEKEKEKEKRNEDLAERAVGCASQI
jgi:hypothetical protein